MNLIIIKFFVNATQPLLSLGEDSNCELNNIKFFVNATQLMLSLGEDSNYELNHS